ncbi:hydroxymethylglutaryl-CoA reductase [Vibrio sp. SCSIO 43136]|uniref:hydroxymethylglutaryl-CoA reductase n=1 Tax=Vibrio sp. SCSIO 43136 TaxID=2819101 RepID=UPI0020765F15|nr:hydroxymethylglutaryl-CoA reductase [Vibrio sp. SCSIO 43136]USD68019.1 hydroxymethylglutaryl-CoA reductase [Vibrio sp. SCSIO 43136]
MPKLNLSSSVQHPALSCEKATQDLTTALASKHHAVDKSHPRSPFIREKTVEKRWQALDNPDSKQALLDPMTLESMESYEKNIEHFIGTVKLPVGIAGPLRVNGMFAQGDYSIPLATTEAALVASYDRGSKLITAAGGASALLINEGVTRTPAFAFDTLAQAGQFVAWVTTQFDTFRTIAESTTAHGKLKDINVNIEANNVYLVFEYLTGDASGQNMVTISTNKVYEYVLEHCPIEPNFACLDGNLSGDKKANAFTMRHVRGKKVSAEVTLSKALVEKYLHTTPELMERFGRMTTSGALLSGSLGVNAHYANALAALYIALGQDAACVSESAIGTTRMEVTQDGGLYASVTLPNLMVGTVGGGTGLPSQKACLDLMGLHGSGNAKALAEVCASVCLAGELSIVGAFTAGHFSRAHHKLAR